MGHPLPVFKDIQVTEVIAGRFCPFPVLISMNAGSGELNPATQQLVPVFPFGILDSPLDLATRASNDVIFAALFLWRARASGRSLGGGRFGRHLE